MAEKVYTTRGIVLQKRAFGEASLSLFILTEDMGLLSLRAQSARKEKGKLRFALEPMTTARFSFVRGKEMYRLIGADVEERFLGNSRRARLAQGQVTRLLVRLVQGEEKHPKLFELVAHGFHFISICKEKTVEDAECILVLSLLKELGYVGEDTSLQTIIDVPLSEMSVMKMRYIRPHAVKTINTLIATSGL